ncbi:MFS transporter [Diaminobutyricibacter tongyongensis]|uniref:MFS transporter n=1 Tax=Leifsonia tongyongensis TaxID=1268043 RepID=A0A6L9XZ64_9MICO|nr:MFS transporter [Diaminobutyricibacter tongyongensis]NEN06555.1 MFS transporter [Diaminobutyricibacter tongyongensis]
MTAPAAVAKPQRTPLSPGFNRLWSSAIASNLADGIGRTAVPLIATTLTRDPALIAGLTAVTFLPWLIFGIPAGMLLDRVDRRVAMAVANTLRFAVAALLSVLIATGGLTIWWLYACVLLFGMGETVFDNATTTVVPSLVTRDQLDRANGRMQSAEIVVQNFIATPIAGFLFAVAIGLPIWLTGSGFLVAGLLALAIPAAAARGYSAARSETGEVETPRPAFGAVVSFLIHQRFLRNMIVLTSVTASALAFAQGSVVLLLLQTFAVPPAAIGVVTAAVGVGALIGALTASIFVERFGRGRVMFSAVLVSGAGLLGVGVTSNVFIAITAYAIGAFGVAVWNVPWGALRQAIVPSDMLGRAMGIIRTIGWGLTPIATVLGGFVARIDLRLPFVIGGGLVVVLALIATRLLLSAGAQAPQHANETQGNAS